MMVKILVGICTVGLLECVKTMDKKELKVS